MKLLGLSVALLLVAPVLAQDAATVKKTLQAQYNKEAAALMKKNVEAALSINTSDYTVTDIKGKSLSLAQIKQAFSQLTAISESIQLSSTVEKVTLKGNTAVVVTSDKSLFVLVNPQNGQKGKMEGTSRNEDLWVQKNGAWKRQKNKVLSNKTLLNGKPLPN
jgi:hypothetical protein